MAEQIQSWAAVSVNPCDTRPFNFPLLLPAGPDRHGSRIADGGGPRSAEHRLWRACRRQGPSALGGAENPAAAAEMESM